MRIWLALAVVAGIAAVSATFWIGRGQKSIPVADLARLESAIDPSLSPVHAALAWSFEIIGGRTTLTDADLDRRLVDGYRGGDTAEEIQALFDHMLAEVTGPVSLVRIHEIDHERGTAVGIGAKGVMLLVDVAVDEQGRIGLWQFSEPPSGPRIPPWQTGLLVAAGWAFVGAGLLARRSGRSGTVSGLTLGSITVLAQVLALSDAPSLYLIGRLAPALVLPCALWVLVDTCPVKGRRWILATGALAAVQGAVAVWLVDPVRLGHPPIPGITDSPDQYRQLLTAAAGTTAATMAVLAALVWRSRRVWRSQGDPAPWVVLAAAGLWAVTAGAAALDLGLGDAALSGDVVPGATLVVLALVPVASALTSVHGMWGRAELADLVVEIERGHLDLQSAVARALGDDSVCVLRWSDEAAALVDEGGRPAGAEVEEGRRRTHLMSSGRLVGALEHDAFMLRRPDRLQAVAAVTGMALQVERLNAQVMTQLEEVRTSRSRIVSAGDLARRRVERDLHDGAQQRLVALGLLLQRGRRLVDGRVCDEVGALLDRASGEVRDALTELREVSRGMNPTLLNERGLAAAIEGLAERLPIAIEVGVVAGRVSHETELTSYYVVAEALTNVIKHSGAPEASVTVEHQADGHLRIVVEDHGCGGAAAKSGSGLEGLSDRVSAIGGELRVVSPMDQGTTVEAVLPCG
ncbi:MAG: histidine kinase [Acidimicrobiia bacterium]|nr:histidine kinase [Acidimicrobiia bacterium]